MIITARQRTPATEMQVASEVTRLLERRAVLERPPPTMTVSDAVALGIAGLFSNASFSGQVLDRFHTRGSIDGDELIEAATFEQGLASPEGYAALRCLILWAHGRLHRRDRQRAPLDE